MTLIAIDVMSGDREPRDYVAGVLLALQADAGLRALLVGRRTAIEGELTGWPASLSARVELVDASQVVAMDEAPREAIRHKKQSSMRLAVDLVKEGRAVACVSAGNTGALTAMAHFVLKTVPGVERAAIVSAIPAAHGHTQMLDLGANTKATPEQLRQFAAMGAIVARHMQGIAQPRIGLLNIGEEDIKGHEIVQAAHALLGGSNGNGSGGSGNVGNYVGFVEGDDIFSGDVDVVVTDGFTGNVALKTMEGAARLIADRVRHEFNASLRDRLAGWAARPVLRRVAAGLDPSRYNGACMVGLAGIVVKSHGRAEGVAFSRAVATAALAARRELTAHVAQALHMQGS
ncbi:MAG TPA: phosphate acyltransferase PlsX [Steroidobacteraceae bacterium]|nr:phosphate acyltransferase PlsX [Steroidobacteraceae bacterium]